MTLPLARTLSASSFLHLFFVLGETTLPHPTAHARLAVTEMLSGALRFYFWIGAALVALGRTVGGVPCFLLRSCWPVYVRTAYVQAGQIVPLA
jgi:hypothetical protein